MVIEGIIRPPPEIRAVADRTAKYVAKNGRAFENRILGSAKGQAPKFGFLHTTSPFHAYYENQISIFEEKEKENDKSKSEGNSNDSLPNEDRDQKNEHQQQQGKEENKNENSGEGQGLGKGENKIEEDEKGPKKPFRKIDKKQKASIIDPIAKALLAERAKIKEYMKNTQSNFTDTGATSQAEEKQQQPATQQLNGATMSNGPNDTVQTNQNVVLPPTPSLQRKRYVDIVAPSSLNVAQVELIHLVAQFTALDACSGGAKGKSIGKIGFLSKLVRREWSNPVFAFCQPRHGHFAYFSALVDAYRTMYDLWTATDASADSQKKAIPTPTSTGHPNNEVNPASSTQNSDDTIAHTANEGNHHNTIINSDTIIAFEKMSNNPQQCLQVAAYHAEYDRQISEIERQQQEKWIRKQQEQATEDGEISAGGGAFSGILASQPQIDWHDFIVVETIEFPPEEAVELSMLPPPPMQQDLPPPPPPLPPSTSRVVAPQQQSTLLANHVAADAGVANVNNDMDESDHDDDDHDEPIRVVPSYKPKVVSASASFLQTNAANMMAIDPITGQSIPMKDMPEHMRIQLLDPKWSEERKKFQEKQKDSNFVSGDMIASNISRFVDKQKKAEENQSTFSSHIMLSGNGNDATINSSKRRLEEANRIIREQGDLQRHAQQIPSSSVGPALAPTAMPNMMNTSAMGTNSSNHHVPSYGQLHKRPRIGGSVQNQYGNTNSNKGMTLAPPSQYQEQVVPPGLPLVLPANVAGTLQQQSGSAMGSLGAVGFQATAKMPALPPPPAQPHLQLLQEHATSIKNAKTIITPDSTTAPSNATIEADKNNLHIPQNNHFTLQIRIPNDPSQMAWNFYGQIVSLSSVDDDKTKKITDMTKIKEVKQALSKLHLNHMPPNKIQLKSHALGVFLKDSATLEASSIGPKRNGGITLEMIPKTRGGRK